MRNGEWHWRIKCSLGMDFKFQIRKNEHKMKTLQKKSHQRKAQIFELFKKASLFKSYRICSKTLT